LQFTVEESNEIYSATIYAVESSIDASTLSLKARALYANAERKLKPGQSAKIEIPLDEIKNAIVIPSLSSLAEMGMDIVYVYRNGKAEQIVVQKGIRTASAVQIIRGLNAGDTLIVTGVMQLRDGLAVNIDNIIR
jgi:membrane fusion protein (multidrug efflux system)